jgi:hypothetical protein
MKHLLYQLQITPAEALMKFEFKIATKNRQVERAIREFKIDLDIFVMNIVNQLNDGTFVEDSIQVETAAADSNDRPLAKLFIYFGSEEFVKDHFEMQSLIEVSYDYYFSNYLKKKYLIKFVFHIFLKFNHIK